MNLVISCPVPLNVFTLWSHWIFSSCSWLMLCLHHSSKHWLIHSLYFYQGLLWLWWGLKEPPSFKVFQCCVHYYRYVYITWRNAKRDGAAVPGYCMVVHSRCHRYSPFNFFPHIFFYFFPIVIVIKAQNGYSPGSSDFLRLLDVHFLPPSSLCASPVTSNL